MNNLYARLGELLIQAENLGTIQLPNAGEIGRTKMAIFNALRDNANAGAKPKKESDEKTTGGKT